MEMVFTGLGGLVSLIGLGCYIVVLIHAFKQSVGQGFMVLCIPCYNLYYAFTKFEHPKKGLVLGGWLGGSIVGNVLVSLGQPKGGRSGFNNM